MTVGCWQLAEAARTMSRVPRYAIRGTGYALAGILAAYKVTDSRLSSVVSRLSSLVMDGRLSTN